MPSKEETAALFGVDAATIRRWRSAAGLRVRREGEGYDLDEIAQLAGAAKRPNPLHAQPSLSASTLAHSDPDEQDTSPPSLRVHARAPLAHLARAGEQQATLEAILHAQARIETQLAQMQTLLEAHLAQHGQAQLEGVPHPTYEAIPSERAVPPARPHPYRAGRLTKADAVRLIGRHGANYHTAKAWPWPASALVSEEAALSWALDYVAGDWKRGGSLWRDRCDQADCPCHQRGK